MPKVGFGDGVPGPIRKFEVFEDDPCFLIFILVIVPDVEVARAAAGFGDPRPLKPRVLVGSMVNNQLGDDPDSALVGLVEKVLEIVQCAVVRVDAVVIGDVVAIVFQGRRIEGKQPQAP